jgi:acetylornithine deacetylase
MPLQPVKHTITILIYYCHQNSPAQGLIPQEDRASNHVLEALAPFMKENGGLLEVERVSAVEGRGNVIIKYPGTSSNGEVVSFVGSHLDVVPASETGWDRYPFSLIQEGDKLYGRGTTDCLGHVALLTDFMISLAEKKIPLKQSVVVIFISNEENSSFTGIGVDYLMKEGYMDQLKAGPLFWIDSADSQPCIGTAGMMQWKLKATGKLFHSGLPHKGINAIDFGIDAIHYIKVRFFQDFPKHPLEEEYNFATQSTLKATQISTSPGALNQLPGEVIIQGDVRLTPFYDVAEVRRRIESYVNEINADPSICETPDIHGPHSKYSLDDGATVGRLELTWIFEGENGIAVNIKSKGFNALSQATEEVLGSVKAYSIGGSLPLVRELQQEGFDVQISGYGLSSRYGLSLS